MNLKIMFFMICILITGCSTKIVSTEPTSNNEISLKCDSIDVEHDVSIIINSNDNDELITKKIHGAYSGDVLYFDYHFQTEWINSTDFVYADNRTERDFICKGEKIVVQCKYTSFSTVRCFRI